MTKKIIQERFIRRIATFGIVGKLQPILQARKKPLPLVCMGRRVGDRASFEEKVKNIPNFHGTHITNKIFFVVYFTTLSKIHNTHNTQCFHFIVSPNTAELAHRKTAPRRDIT